MTDKSICAPGTETAKRSTCCTCGWTWPTGRDGSHSCSAVLYDDLQEARKEIAALRAAGQAEPSADRAALEQINVRIGHLAHGAKSPDMPLLSLLIEVAEIAQARTRAGTTPTEREPSAVTPGKAGTEARHGYVPLPQGPNADLVRKLREVADKMAVDSKPLDAADRSVIQKHLWEIYG